MGGLASRSSAASGQPTPTPTSGRQVTRMPSGQAHNPWLQGNGNHGPSTPVTDFADDDELAPAPPSASSAAAAATREGGPLAISTRIEYAALPRGLGQDVFGIVTLQADMAARGPAAAEVRQPLDIICVLDVSGSMSGEKIKLVQDAVGFVIREAQPQDRLCIVAFNSAAWRVLRLRRMDDHGKTDAKNKTDALSTGGGTHIANGLETALEVAERRRWRNPVSAILLLTDGQDGSGAGSYQPLIERARRAGCSLYPFGFGADHDARLLAGLAEQASAPFTFVEDVDQIGAAFAGAMGGLSTVAAQRIEVTLTPHVTLKAVHTPFPVTQDGGRTVVQIPDMLAGERRDLLVELSVPSQDDGASEVVLLTAAAQYWDLTAGAAAQAAGAEMRLLRVSAEEPQPELEPDAEVVTQRNRVEVAQTLEAAAAHGEAGRFEEAQAMLLAHEGKLKGRSKLSPVDEGLALELADAKERMKSRSSWENGGMAEVRDAMQMHKLQRTTNVSASRASPTKCSKAMYATGHQQEWLSKAP